MPTKKQVPYKFHIVKLSVHFPGYDFYAVDLDTNLRDIIKSQWMYGVYPKLKPIVSVPYPRDIEAGNMLAITNVIRCDLTDDRIDCVFIMYDEIRNISMFRNILTGEYCRTGANAESRLEDFSAQSIFEIGEFEVEYFALKLKAGSRRVKLSLKFQCLETITMDTKAAKQYAIEKYGFTTSDMVRKTFSDIMWKRGEAVRNADAEMRRLCHDKTQISSCWLVLKRDYVQRINLTEVLQNIVAVFHDKDAAYELCNILNEHYKGRAKYDVREVHT